MGLYLFTNFFPHTGAEPFLTNEFRFTRQRFHTVECLSLYGDNMDNVLDDEVLSASFVINRTAPRWRLLVDGVFNGAPAGHHFSEIFRKKLFLKPGKLYWWLVSLIITRTVLSSPSFRRIKLKIADDPKPLLYFYWCENLCWTLPYLADALGNPKLRVVIRLHGGDLYEERKAGYAPLREKTFSLASSIYPVSQNGFDYLAKKYPQFTGKMQVSRLGVFNNGLNPDETCTEFTLVSVASLVPVKQVLLLFEALQQMSTKAVWHHFGGGPLEADLREKVKHRRKSLKVILHGHLNNDSILKFYRTTHVDLFVNTSSSEGLPVAIMEALSFGIPVLAPAVGGIPEVVSEQNGALLKAGFVVGDLVKALERLAANDAIKNRALRTTARATFEAKVNAEVNYPRFYNSLGGG